MHLCVSSFRTDLVHGYRHLEVQKVEQRQKKEVKDEVEGQRAGKKSKG